MQRNMSALDAWREPPLTAANDNEALPAIIGLMGYGGSGKSTVRQFLCDAHGYQARHIKEPIAVMTTVLMNYAGVAMGSTDETSYIDGDLKRQPIPELGGRSSTEIQQFIGTELGRDFCYPDLWLDIWLRWASRVTDGGGRVVQESVRFENEAEAIRSRGGMIIEVRRPGYAPVNDHVSESLPVKPDAVLDNNGTLDELGVGAESVLRGVD